MGTAVDSARVIRKGIKLEIFFKSARLTKIIIVRYNTYEVWRSIKFVEGQCIHDHRGLKSN
jgi:hypothetical protein